MRVFVVGTDEGDIQAARARAEAEGDTVVSSATWAEAAAAFDAAQCEAEAVILASDPVSPMAVGVVWTLRARNPFLPISPPGVTAPARRAECYQE